MSASLHSASLFPLAPHPALGLAPDPPLRAGAQLPATGSAPRPPAPSQPGICCTWGPCAGPGHIRAELSPAVAASQDGCRGTSTPQSERSASISRRAGGRSQGPHPSTHPSNNCPTPPGSACPDAAGPVPGTSYLDHFWSLTSTPPYLLIHPLVWASLFGPEGDEDTEVSDFSQALSASEWREEDGGGESGRSGCRASADRRASTTTPSDSPFLYKFLGA